MKKEIVAHCYSLKCVGNFKHNSSVKYKIKDVKKTATNCPDCNNSLLWKPERARLFVKDCRIAQNRRKSRAIKKEKALTNEVLV